MSVDKDFKGFPTVKGVGDAAGSRRRRFKMGNNSLTIGWDESNEEEADDA